MANKGWNNGSVQKTKDDFFLSFEERPFQEEVTMFEEDFLVENKSLVDFIELRDFLTEELRFFGSEKLMFFP